MLEAQDSGQPLGIHEFGGETLVNDVLFDQLEFLVDHFARCDSFGCPECRRFFGVREKLMKPFVEVKYHQFAIAEQRSRSRAASEQPANRPWPSKEVKSGSTIS
jgi:hypothetical protein